MHGERAVAASATAGRSLKPAAIMVNTAPVIELRPDPEAMVASSLNCDPSVYGNASLFFLRPWQNDNMAHVVMDATMVLWHLASTPKVPGRPTLIMLKDPYAGSQPDRVDLAWVDMFYGHASFPGGLLRPETAPLGSGVRVHCVSSVHWGAPNRPSFSNDLGTAERRRAQTVLREHVHVQCGIQPVGVDPAKVGRGSPGSGSAGVLGCRGRGGG